MEKSSNTRQSERLNFQYLADSGYTLKRFLGKGSVGIVYEATNREGLDVAIKVMEVTPFIDEKMLRMIVDGALATQKISPCARVAEIYDTGSFENYYYIVMPFYKGGVLEEYIENKNVSLKTKLKIAHSLSQTLYLIHDAGIIHGDLKPSNVLLDDDNYPYLIDFYQAGLKPDYGGMNNFPKGTPLYMSPEQALGKFVSASSDIYSFGVLLYELFTGYYPYEMRADNVTAMVNVIQNSAIIPPSRRKREVSGKLEAVIMKALNKHRDDRYANMRKMTADLESCIKGGELSIPYKRSLKEKIMGIFGK